MERTLLEEIQALIDIGVDATVAATIVNEDRRRRAGSCLFCFISFLRHNQMFLTNIPIT